MKYNQKYGNLLKSELEIDLQETGFNYTFTDRSLFGPPRMDNAFIPYTNITNQKNYTKRAQPYVKRIIVPLGVLFVLCFIAIVVSYSTESNGTPYEQYLNIGFYAALFTIFAVYKLIGVQKVITMQEHNGLMFTIFNDDQAEAIIKDILSRRNKYLKDKFIDNNNYKTLSLESVEYLASVGVVDREEANQIKEKIRPNTAGSVGFNLQQAGSSSI